MKTLAFCYILTVILTKCIAIEILQTDEVFERKQLTKKRKANDAITPLIQKVYPKWLTKIASTTPSKTREKRQTKNVFSEKIMRMIEDNFPCRDPKTLALISSGTTYFKQSECLQCTCYMGKFTCEKNVRKCYPHACHLQDDVIVQNLATHNDGCNNCLCRYGQLICTHLRCSEVGNGYTNYKSTGLKNVQPGNNLELKHAQLPVHQHDSCTECDHLTGSRVCGLKQWKTFPTFCHAMFCGKNDDDQIDDRGDCESIDPCVPYPCGKHEKCVPFVTSSCLASENTSLCQQFKCIPTPLKCPEEDNSSAVCAEDNQSYESQCETLSTGVRFAYRGLCKKNCQSEVCGIEGRTFESRCHANEVNAHIDYNGRCEYHFNSALVKDDEKGSSFEDERCVMVYDNGRCAPVKCNATVIPPGGCCPICGAALVIGINHKAVMSVVHEPYRLSQLHTFIGNNVNNARCKISVDLTHTNDILVVIRPYNRRHLDTCKDLAVEISDRINFERGNEEKGILKILGASTLIKEKAGEGINNPSMANFA